MVTSTGAIEGTHIDCFIISIILFFIFYILNLISLSLAPSAFPNHHLGQTHSPSKRVQKKMETIG